MKNLGFTMIEVLVVLSILAILLAIAPSGFTTFIRGSEMVANSNDIVGAFNYARMEAVKRGSPVQLGQRNGSTWTGGMVVWIDKNSNGSFDVGVDEVLRFWEAYNSGNSLISDHGITQFTFDATGGIDNADVLRLCDNRSGEVGRDISVLSSGAIFADKVNCV
ncbi:GspH/FimT family pseudopilin [Psychromonas hadalis]|uniref:GspH/FimT family pseudopilin n=1 Tax=Psychromonas hadalis TaxID=211669 RepID=UPI0003B3898D|nr:GspH/FimT family pseudopilin [Psychromonas hadalis]